MLKNKKLLGMGLLLGILLAGGSSAFADEEYTPEAKSDYQVCMDYCMPEPTNTFKHCNSADVCGQYAKTRK